MRYRKMQIVLLIFTVVLNIVNIALFSLWWSLVRVEVDHPGRDSEHVLNALSIQFVFLEVVLASVAIAFAILGFVGYQAVKDAAVNKSLEETKKQVQTHLNKLVLSDGMDVSQPTNTDPVPKIEPANIKLEEGI